MPVLIPGAQQNVEQPAVQCLRNFVGGVGQYDDEHFDVQVHMGSIVGCVEALESLLESDNIVSRTAAREILYIMKDNAELDVDEYRPGAIGY